MAELQELQELPVLQAIITTEPMGRRSGGKIRVESWRVEESRWQARSEGRGGWKRVGGTNGKVEWWQARSEVYGGWRRVGGTNGKIERWQARSEDGEESVASEE